MLVLHVEANQDARITSGSKSRCSYNKWKQKKMLVLQVEANQDARNTSSSK